MSVHFIYRRLTYRIRWWRAISRRCRAFPLPHHVCGNAARVRRVVRRRVWLYFSGLSLWLRISIGLSICFLGERTQMRQHYVYGLLRKSTREPLACTSAVHTRGNAMSVEYGNRTYDASVCLPHYLLQSMLVRSFDFYWRSTLLYSVIRFRFIRRATACSTQLMKSRKISVFLSLP